MYKIEVDVSEVDERIADLGGRLKVYPEKMRDVVAAWQVEDLHRTTPEIETPDLKSVRTTKGERRRERALRQFGQRLRRRIIRKLTPKPVRQLRKYVRLGKRPMRVLLPAPIRRARKFARQFKGVKAGKPAAVRRAIAPLRRLHRLQRRIYMSANLTEALIDKLRKIEL